MVCLSFILILVIVMGFKNDDETKTLKQCLTGYYKFPDCISKYNEPILIWQID